MLAMDEGFVSLYLQLGLLVGQYVGIRRFLYLDVVLRLYHYCDQSVDLSNILVQRDFRS